MTIRLRPHHLLCILTYAGKGYSPAFTANYDAIAERIARGEGIVLVEGPDDICAPLMKEDAPHCLADSVARRDRQAAEAICDLLSRPMEPGARMVLSPSRILEMRHAFAAGATRRACDGCEWASLCTDIAADGFRDTRIGLREAAT